MIPILLVIMNFIYSYFFFEKDLQKYSPIITKIRKAVSDSLEIVYLGESSNTTYRINDTDTRPISGILQDYYPTIRIGDITKEASHSGMYYEYLRNIPENKTIKTVIVTMNLRSFNANWIYSDLETPLQKSILLLKDYPPLYSRFLLAFKSYDNKTIAEREKQFKYAWKHDKLVSTYPLQYSNVIEWDKAVFSHKFKNADGTPNDSLTVLACHYIKGYAFTIDVKNNPRIKDFDTIVKLAKSRNWNLIFVIMAENMETANTLVGKELTSLMTHNRDILVNRYSKSNVLVIDNLDKIPNKQFIDQNWTTEHYAQDGRRIIAQNIAIGLKKWYNNKYISY